MHVRYDARAIDQIYAIRHWIADHADDDAADRIVDSLFERCETLSEFPRRGTPQPDIHPKLRTIPHRGRYTIGYMIEADTVLIVGIRSAGQDLNVLTGD